MNKAFRSAALFFMVEQHDGKRGGLFSYLWRQNRGRDENHAGPLAGFEPTVQPTAGASKFW